MWLLWTVGALLAGRAALAAPSGEDDFVWINGELLGLHGKAFSQGETAAFFDRLPAKAHGVVRGPVWDLSRDSAGMFLQFKSNSKRLAVQIQYLYETTTMYHFPSTGVAGLDLYAWDTNTSTWRWTATTRTNKYPSSTNEMDCITTGVLTTYRLHLPLYNGVVQLKVGHLPKSTLRADDQYRTPPPIVWYGTSIAQGGVVSRPGQAFTNSIGRGVGREVYNFGFSGNGKMELNVAQYLANISSVGAFVIDCNWNMVGTTIAASVQPLVKLLRSAHPTTPIILAEGTTAGQAWAIASSAETQAAKKAALKAGYDALVAAGDTDLHYVRGADLYKIIGDEANVVSPTVAGCHPSDLGQRSIADYYIKLLPSILKDEKAASPREATEEHVAAIPVSEEDRQRHRHIVETAFTSETTQASGGHARNPAAMMSWTPLQHLEVMGRAFNNTKSFFNRLPANAEHSIREEVWNLSLMNTGMFVPFISSATSFSLNFSVGDTPTPLWHMPSTGMHGADLFRYDPATKQYRFVGCVTSFPSAANQSHTAPLAAGLPGESARYILHLPLRNFLLEGSLGADSHVASDPAFTGGVNVDGRAPVVWYGTSICQGGVASRPGSTYTNILTRNLQRMVLNFGFAGNGKMELNVTRFLVEIDAAAFVIDCLPNLGASSVAHLTVPLVNYIRSVHPSTPILLVAGTTYGDHWISPESNDSKRAALKKQYDALIASGVTNLHLMLNTHNELFAGLDLENPTVGGTHPSDLGHREMAAFYTEFLPSVLSE